MFPSQRQQQRQLRKPTPKPHNLLPLLHFIQTCNWEAVCKRLKSHPQEAAIKQTIQYATIGVKNTYPLHHACIYDGFREGDDLMRRRFGLQSARPVFAAAAAIPPPHVLKLLVQAFPQAASVGEGVGGLPLHLFLRFALRENYNDETETGESTCNSRNIRLEQMKELLRPNPMHIATTPIVENRIERKVPLVVLFERYAMEIAVCEIELLRFRNLQTNDPTASFSPWWNECILLIRAAYHNTVNDGNDDENDNDVDAKNNNNNSSSNNNKKGQTFQLVHACCSLLCRGMCPLPLLRLALIVYPRQVQTTEKKYGRLPLHILAATESMGSSNHQYSHGFEKSDKQPNNSNNLNVIKTFATEAVFNLFSPAASMKDKKGKTPLILAIDTALATTTTKQRENRQIKKWNGGDHYDCMIQTLLDKAPQVVMIRDVETGLYPFMLAATVLSKMKDEEEQEEGEEENRLVKSSLSQQHDCCLDAYWVTTTYLLLRTDPSVVRICLF